jgi:hypothetical protein
VTLTYQFPRATKPSLQETSQETWLEVDTVQFLDTAEACRWCRAWITMPHNDAQSRTNKERAKLILSEIGPEECAKQNLNLEAMLNG